jgi:F0F1-type ATP synthase beta subunit
MISDPTTFAHLDATTVLSRNLAAKVSTCGRSIRFNFNNVTSWYCYSGTYDIAETVKHYNVTKNYKILLQF